MFGYDSDNCPIFRCDSIGSTNMTALAAGLKGNHSIEELCLNHNTLKDPSAFMEEMVTFLQVQGILSVPLSIR